jgi:hypothetical protein
MKTLFVCSERKINDHVGEYYDDVIEVPHQPVVDAIEEVARLVRESIRSLWRQDLQDPEREGEPCVRAFLDAASPFNAMLIDYQIVVGKEENIKLELPYLESVERTTEDREANELIKKLEERGEKDAEI